MTLSQKILLAFLMLAPLGKTVAQSPKELEQLWNGIEVQLPKSATDTAHYFILQKVRARCGNDYPCLYKTYDHVLKELENRFKHFTGMGIAKEMVALAEKNKNLNDKGDALGRLAQCYGYLHNHVIELSYFKQQQRAYEQAGNEEKAIKIRSFISELPAYSFGGADKVLLVLKNDLQEATDKGFTNLANQLRVRIKIIADDFGFEAEFAEQVKELEKIRLSNLLNPDECVIAYHAASGRGDLLQKQKKYDQAKNYYLKAVSVYEFRKNKHNDTWRLVHVLLRIANMEWKRRNLSEAKIFIDKAYRIADKNAMHDQIIIHLKLKTEIALFEKNYEEAYLFTNEIIERQAIIQRNESQTDIEKSQMELVRERLEADAKNQATELKLKNAQLVSTYIAVVLVLMLAAGIFIGFRRQRKTAQKLAAQNTLISQQAEQLQLLDSAKTRFFTNISHEFRTPLTVILGMAEQLSQSGKTNKKEAIELIQRNGQTLLTMVNQILDLSKMDSGLLHLNLTQSDIIVYLQYLTESFYTMAQERDIRLQLYAETPVLTMDFDTKKIQSIVSNLLSNALKFTPKGGKVVLHAHQVADCLQLKVQDSGRGIPQKDLPHIFDRFYQADNATSRKGEGTGIGLALVKELIELLGGSVAVESTEGRGTTFTLKLPITHNAPVVEIANLTASADRLTPIFTEEGGLENTPLLVKDGAVRAEGRGEVFGDKPLLLLIEDNADVVTYIKGLLQNDYQIEWAENGQIGIEKALESIPDVIISDVMMPQKDGFEVCDTLKNDQRTSHIPIVLLTAKATQADKLAGLRTGADAYLEKPFHQEELFVRLEKLVELRRTLQEKYRQTAPATTTKTHTPPTLEDVFLQKINQVIAENIDNADFGIAQLCHATALSHTQVFRKLKALTGQNPTLYIRQVRLNHSLLLLQNPDLNVSEIAYAVGFADPNYFSRVFSEVFQKSPEEMRKSL